MMRERVSQTVMENDSVYLTVVGRSRARLPITVKTFAVDAFSFNLAAGGEIE